MLQTDRGTGGRADRLMDRQTHEVHFDNPLPLHDLGFKKNPSRIINAIFP